MPTSVQFFGLDAVLQAFDNSDCSNWSILQGKQFMFKYEGCSQKEGYDNLKAMLQMIQDSGGSEATYELRTYDLGDEGDNSSAEGASLLKKKKSPPPKKKQEKRKIYASTDYDGSFNFKLYGQGGPTSPKRMEYQENLALRGEVDQLKKTVQELLKELNEPEEKETGIAGMFNSLLDQPEMRSAIVGKVVQLFDHFGSKIGSRAHNPEPVYPVPAQVAGPALDPLPDPVKPQEINLTQYQATRLNEAVAILVRIDPAFCDNLYKLAQVAHKSPATYATLIDMLKKM